MIRDLTARECQLVDALHDHTIPTDRIHGRILAGLLGLGYVEITWAGRARLTPAGRALFDIEVGA
jgi:hypothetical protein